MNVKEQPKNNSECRKTVIILNACLVNGEIHQKLEANPFCRVRGKSFKRGLFTLHGLILLQQTVSVRYCDIFATSLLLSISQWLLKLCRSFAVLSSKLGA